MREYRAWSDFDREQDDMRVYSAADVGALLARIRAVSDDIRYAIDHEAWGLASEASDTLDDLLTEGGK